MDAMSAYHGWKLYLFIISKMKTVLLKVFAVIVAAMAVSCSPSLESQIEQANKQCPVKVPGVGQIKSIEYKDNTVTYNCQVMNRSFNLAALEGHEDAMKSAMMPMMKSLVEGKNSIGKVLVKENASLALHYFTKGPRSSSVTVTFTPEEIKAVIDGEVKDDPLTKLKTQVDVSRVQCPMKVDSSTSLTDIEAKDGYVVYTYELKETGDEEGIVDTLAENADEVRASLLEAVQDKSDKETEKVVQLCKDAGYGILYKYVGAKSGKTFEVKFEASEL